MAFDGTSSQLFLADEAGEDERRSSWWQFRCIYRRAWCEDRRDRWWHGRCRSRKPVGRWSLYKTTLLHRNRTKKTLLCNSPSIDLRWRWHCLVIEKNPERNGHCQQVKKQQRRRNVPERNTVIEKWKSRSKHLSMFTRPSTLHVDTMYS